MSDAQDRHREQQAQARARARTAERARVAEAVDARGGLGLSQSGVGDDGRYRVATEVSQDMAEAEASRVTREQFERYMNEFAPSEKALIGSLGSGLPTPDEAAASAQGDAERARASLSRMRDRYGTTQTASAAASENRLNQLDTSLASLGASNNARQAQEDRDYTLQGSLLNLGNNLRSSSLEGLTNASTNAAAREQAEDSAKERAAAANRQRNTQLASTAVMAAAMYAFAS